MQKVRGKKRLLDARRLVSLPLQKLSGYWKTIHSFKFHRQKNRNSKLETGSRRRFTSRHYYETIRRIWRAAYERVSVEGILQSRARIKETATNEEGNSRGSRRGDRRGGKRGGDGEKFIRLAKLFESRDFGTFIELLSKQESLLLEELRSPVNKNKELTFDEYSWFLRGKLESYEDVRQIITEVVKYKNEYAIRSTEKRQ